MSDEKVKVEVKGGVVDILLLAPVDVDSADGIRKAVDGQLQAGQTRFAFDFSRTRLIPSPVVASILEAAEKIVDDHHGKIVVCGLSELNQRVFEMVGVFLFAEQCNTLAEAEVKALL